MAQEPLARHLSIVVSAGRTGSRFIGINSQRWIAQCKSWHEPDVVDPGRLHLLSQIRTFGLRYMTLDRLRARSGIRALSEQWQAGTLSREQALLRLRAARSRLYSECNDKLLVESYSGWWGSLDLLPDISPHLRVAVVARHPVTWVNSALSWGSFHSRGGMVFNISGLRGAGRLSGRQRRIDALIALYERTYGRLLKHCDDPVIPVRLFRFEEVFCDIEILRSLVDWLRVHEDREFPLRCAPSADAPLNRSEPAHAQAIRLTANERERVWSASEDIATELGYSPEVPQ